MCLIIIISKSCGELRCGMLQKYIAKGIYIEDEEILNQNVELQSSSGVKSVEKGQIKEFHCCGFRSFYFIVTLSFYQVYIFH